MAMGTRQKRERQEDLWVVSSEVAKAPAHAFYERLNEVLERHHFDRNVEHLCQRYYKGPFGRPSMTPGTYFRALLLGYFEGMDSERGLGWRLADSLSQRKFLGYALTEETPDHSTFSRTRRLYWLETHKAVFRWVLKILAEEGLIEGKTVGIDATTLEANAALRSLVRQDNGQTYEDYLKELAKAAGIEKPTREQLARWDRKRKKKGSNKEWKNPHDPDARITKMKDGSTHLAHKAEHAVDLSSGALLAVTVQGADPGDTTTLHQTLAEAGEAVVELLEQEVTTTLAEEQKIHGAGIEEVVADKGYHSGAVLQELPAVECRSYIPEPERGRRHWEGKAEEQQQVYANRRRIRGRRSKRLQKKRSELTERSMAHLYETGAMRGVHLKGRDNVLKRLLVHAGGFNLALVMRKLVGVGKPRQLQGDSTCIFARLRLLFQWALSVLCPSWIFNVARPQTTVTFSRAVTLFHPRYFRTLAANLSSKNVIFTTGC